MYGIQGKWIQTGQCSLLVPNSGHICNTHCRLGMLLSSQTPVNKVKFFNRVNRVNKEAKYEDLRQINVNTFQYNFPLLPLLLVSPIYRLLEFILLAIRDTLEFGGKGEGNKTE